MNVYKESSEFYEGAYDIGKQLLWLCLIVFAVVAPKLAMDLVTDFHWFDLVVGVYFVLIIFRLALKISEYEEAYKKSKATRIVTAYGRKFYIGQIYMHKRKWTEYRLISVSNHVNTADFPATAVYQDKGGNVFTRSLFEFSEKFVRYETYDEYED